MDVNCNNFIQLFRYCGKHIINILHTFTILIYDDSDRPAGKFP